MTQEDLHDRSFVVAKNIVKDQRVPVVEYHNVTIPRAEIQLAKIEIKTT